MRKPIFNLVLVDSYMITPRAKHFIFKLENEEFFDFIPGQFISFHMDIDNMPVKRSYSIANLYGNKHIEIAATKVDNGVATKLLYALKPGDMLKTSGPYGRLVMPEELDKRYIFLGTGTGVSPYRSMLPAIKDNLQKDHKVLIAQGVRYQENLMYSQDFNSLSEHKNYEFRAYYSQEKSDKLDNFEHKGYVQEWLKELSLCENDHIFVCGSPNMIQDVIKYLDSIEFKGKLYREKYYSA
jgi:NAD(P)H-flavin reductase